MSNLQFYTTSAGTNREVKDSVFRDLFGSEERKENALSLYNALNGTAYTDPKELTLTTISGVIYMTHKNDVSFLIGNELVLWEHQSTANPNMPLRGLFYFSELYSARIDRNKRSLYSGPLIKLPSPRYVVFYCGKEDRPDREELRLSDSFEGGKGDLEVVATVLNVQEGHNSAIMDACETLAGYSHLVSLAYRYAESMPFEKAIDRAVQQCIIEGVLANYLRERRAEVVSTLLTEFDEAEELRKIGDGWYEQGRAEGVSEERARNLTAVAGLVASGMLDIGAASSAFGISEDELSALLATL